MNKPAVLLLAALVSVGGGSRADSPPAPPAPAVFGKANKQRIEAFVMLIRLRGDLFARWKATGTWPDDKEANQALAAHGKYWEDQLKQGRALLAGGMKGEYWDNVALIVFEAKSEAEAETIVQGDPAVKALVFQAQVRPFDVHFVTNKFQEQP